MKARAVGKKIGQISPDNYETIPVIIDLNDAVTFRWMRNEMKRRLGLHKECGVWVFTIVINEDD